MKKNLNRRSFLKILGATIAGAAGAVLGIQPAEVSSVSAEEIKHEFFHSYNVAGPVKYDDVLEMFRVMDSARKAGQEINDLGKAATVTGKALDRLSGEVKNFEWNYQIEPGSMIDEAGFVDFEAEYYRELAENLASFVIPENKRRELLEGSWSREEIQKVYGLGLLESDWFNKWLNDEDFADALAEAKDTTLEEWFGIDWMEE